MVRTVHYLVTVEEIPDTDAKTGTSTDAQESKR